VLLRTGVRDATGTAVVTTDRERIGTRTIVATIGNAPSPMVAKLDLPNARGRIPTDCTLRVEGPERIWPYCLIPAALMCSRRFRV
jgi:NADH:ubiquinone reductase (H+-translocating)